MQLEYSPLAEAPYNPHSTQRRMGVIIFSVSESASGFSSINHEWSCIPAFVCFFMCACFFLPPCTPDSKPLGALDCSGGRRWWSADYRCSVSWWELREITQQDTALELRSNFFPSFWKVAPIYTVPTVRPPDVGLPWQPLTHPLCVKVAPLEVKPLWRGDKHARLKTVDWWKKKQKIKNITRHIFGAFPRVVCRRMLLWKQMDKLHATSPRCAQCSACWLAGRGCRGSRWTARTLWTPLDNHLDECVTSFEREHSSKNVEGRKVKQLNQNDLSYSSGASQLQKAKLVSMFIVQCVSVQYVLGEFKELTVASLTLPKFNLLYLMHFAPLIKHST